MRRAVSSIVRLVLLAVLAVFVGGVGTSACGGPGNRYVPDAPPTQIDPLELREELVEMYRYGRGLRIKLAEQQALEEVDPDLVDRIEAMEYRQYERMKQIVALLGNRWPDVELVGREACRAAVMIVQHLDHYRGFQKHALGLLRHAVEKERAPRRYTAYLVDRLRISADKEQVYGTQIRILDGSVVPWPIAEYDGLDRRRRKLGLPPMDEYLERVQREYGLKE